MLNSRDIDIDIVHNSARVYARLGDAEGLELAAHMLLLCTTDRERKTVQWWWGEGCRDYASDEQHLEELREALEERAAEKQASLECQTPRSPR